MSAIELLPIDSLVKRIKIGSRKPLDRFRFYEFENYIKIFNMLY